MLAPWRRSGNDMPARASLRTPHRARVSRISGNGAMTPCPAAKSAPLSSTIGCTPGVALIAAVRAFSVRRLHRRQAKLQRRLRGGTERSRKRGEGARQLHHQSDRKAGGRGSSDNTRPRVPASPMLQAFSLFPTCGPPGDQRPTFLQPDPGLSLAAPASGEGSQALSALAAFE